MATTVVELDGSKLKATDGVSSNVPEARSAFFNDVMVLVDVYLKGKKASCANSVEHASTSRKERLVCNTPRTYFWVPDIQ